MFSVCNHIGCFQNVSARRSTQKSLLFAGVSVCFWIDDAGGGSHRKTLQGSAVNAGVSFAFCPGPCKWQWTAPRRSRTTYEHRCFLHVLRGWCHGTGYDHRNGENVYGHRCFVRVCSGWRERIHRHPRHCGIPHEHRGFRPRLSRIYCTATKHCIPRGLVLHLGHLRAAPHPVRPIWPTGHFIASKFIGGA